MFKAQKRSKDIVKIVHVQSPFFVHKMYSRGFIKLRLNHWYHMDYLNDVFTTFLGLEYGSCFAVYAGSESSQISSEIMCSED